MASREDQDEDLGIIPNRIKDLRKARGMTVETLAERAGYSVGHVNNIENHKRGFTPRSLKKIATALGVKPAELLDTSNAWQTVPVFGFIGEKGVFRPGGSGSTAPPEQVKIPLALGDVVALRVDGSHLYPKYEDGVTIICAKDTTTAATCVGRECLVVLPDGFAMIRHVARGWEDEHYNLTFHNQPPLLNVEIINCRPVLLVLPSA
jgi:DNA-binding XRE family transcriptional regulator